MGPTEDFDSQVSRRGFLGWGAMLMAAATVPGATLLLGETSAAAATMAPYALASWIGLSHRSVQVAAGGRSQAVKVAQVTNLATPSSRRMTGDVFSVTFQASAALPAGIYTITAPGLGSFPLFLAGGGSKTQAVINRRLPA